MNSRLPLVLVCILAPAAAGFSLARFPSSSPGSQYKALHLRRTGAPWLNPGPAAAPADQKVLKSIVRGFILEGLESFPEKLAYIRSLPPPEVAEAWSVVMPTFLYIAPEAALAALLQQPDFSTIQQPLNQLMSNWAQQDPLRAAQAAGEIANPALQAAAFQGIAWGWHGQDPFGAYLWVDSLSAGPQRDAAAAGLPFWKPDHVFTLQAGAFLPEQRLPVLQSIFRTWNKSNPVTAAAALKASNLTPEERRTLSAMMDEGAPRNLSEVK